MSFVFYCNTFLGYLADPQNDGKEELKKESVHYIDFDLTVKAGIELEIWPGSFGMSFPILFLLIFPIFLINTQLFPPSKKGIVLSDFLIFQYCL